MNDASEHKRPDNLSRVLKEWRADTSLPPGFQAAVWGRIDASKGREAVSQPLWHVLSAWFNQLVARPQLAVAYIVFFAMIGMTAGWAQGQKEVARVQDDLAQRYVQTLDPYQVPQR